MKGFGHGRRTGTRGLAGRLRIGAAAVAGLVVLGGAAAIAMAVIPGSDGTIQGCYLKGIGSLRVVDKASDCTRLETPIKWAQNGQAGPAGPPGAQGPQGERGPAGPAGPVAALSGRNDIATASLGPAFPGDAVARCQPGEIATGGGFYIGQEGIEVLWSLPSGGGGTAPPGWAAGFRNHLDHPVTAEVWVVCVRAS
jgi:hypothetical protein